MRKAFFYVGSNNATHELEADKIEQIVAKYFEAFTTYEVVGYWRGHKERTLKVEVLTEESPAQIARIARELKDTLNQEAVLIEIIETNFAMIQ